MKIRIFLASIVLCGLIISCSSSSGSSPEDFPNLSPVSYNLILSGSSGLYGQMVLSDDEGISVGTTTTSFSGFATPEFNYCDGSVISLYNRTNDCGGNFVMYDFKTDKETTVPLFSELAPCNINVIALAQQGNQLFLSYSLTVAGKKDAYFMRSMDLKTKTAIDILLDKRPLAITVSKDRLFILTTDESGSNDNWIRIMDAKENSVIYEMNVGENATKIFKDPFGAIIVSYPESHMILNSTTSESVYTRYVTGIEPNFYNSETFSFDGEGRMYYTIKTDENVEGNGPAVYDFNKNLTTLYFFENFLTESQLQVQFSIKEATTVNYDEANELILIGYQKKGNSGGGIIRITPAPNLTFVDNIDLDDVPYYLFVQ